MADSAALKERYNHLSDDELKELYKQGGLESDAENLLVAVLAARGIVAEELLLESSDKEEEPLSILEAMRTSEQERDLKRSQSQPVRTRELRAFTGRSDSPTQAVLRYRNPRSAVCGLPFHQVPPVRKSVRGRLCCRSAVNESLWWSERFRTCSVRTSEGDVQREV